MPLKLRLPKSKKDPESARLDNMRKGVKRELREWRIVQSELRKGKITPEDLQLVKAETRHDLGVMEITDEHGKVLERRPIIGRMQTLPEVDEERVKQYHAERVVPALKRNSRKRLATSISTIATSTASITHTLPPQVTVPALTGLLGYHAFLIHNASRTRSRVQRIGLLWKLVNEKTAREELQATARKVAELHGRWAQEHGARKAQNKVMDMSPEYLERQVPRKVLTKQDLEKTVADHISAGEEFLGRLKERRREIKRQNPGFIRRGWQAAKRKVKGK